MFWLRGSSKQRRAVLSALAAVGETGMTLLALGIAVNMPEGRVNAILDGLVRSGQVRRRGTPTWQVPGPRNAHYQLAGAGQPPASSSPRRAPRPRPPALDLTIPQHSAVPLVRRPQPLPSARAAAGIGLQPGPVQNS